jgi:hypothetical protein
VHSIAERQDSPTTLFWDELAGHAIWYVGLSLLLGAARRPGRPDPTRSRAAGAGRAVGVRSPPTRSAGTPSRWPSGTAWPWASWLPPRRGLAVDVLVAAAVAYGPWPSSAIMITGR